MHTFIDRTHFVLALACSLPLLTGCLPSRIVIDLAPADEKLTASTVIRDDGASAFSPKVALIEVEGLIAETASPGFIVSDTNAVDTLVRQLDVIEDDDSVKAVVLRINSPGGTVSATELVYEELVRFRERTGKPVVVSMGSVAASGGYYLALAGDELVAQRSSITGSIGVLMQTVNVADGLRRIGIVAPAITSGPNKALANPLEPREPDHERILQSMVDDFYAAFVERVRAHRTGLTDPGVAFDGRVFTGAQALELGLVDRLGTLREAYGRAKVLAQIERARLIRYHRPGAAVSTPYASTPVPQPWSGGVGASTQISLFHLDLDRSLLPTPGFYYVWTGE